MKQTKVLVDKDVECQYCGKSNRILVEKEIVVPGIRAQTEIHIRAERAGTQIKLES